MDFEIAIGNSPISKYDAHIVFSAVFLGDSSLS